jgi:hypothetical protein
MTGTETARSKSGSLAVKEEQREEDLGTSEKTKQKNLNQDLGAEEEQREEGRSTNDRIEQQDLNQGMDTGTSSSTHRGVNWGPGYHVRSTASRKPLKKGDPNKP